MENNLTQLYVARYWQSVKSFSVVHLDRTVDLLWIRFLWTQRENSFRKHGFPRWKGLFWKGIMVWGNRQSTRMSAANKLQLEEKYDYQARLLSKSHCHQFSQFCLVTCNFVWFSQSNIEPAETVVNSIRRVAFLYFWSWLEVLFIQRLHFVSHGAPFSAWTGSTELVELLKPMPSYFSKTRFSYISLNSCHNWLF